MEVIRFCDSCLYLQNLLGRPVLQPLVDRAGIRCDVVTGGTIQVGEAITISDKLLSAICYIFCTTRNGQVVYDPIIGV